MFSLCPTLKTIFADENLWSTAAVTDGYFMFSGCTSLVGGKGTKYNDNQINISYAHIDGGASNPGYLTDINYTSNIEDLNLSTTASDCYFTIDGRKMNGVPVKKGLYILGG